VTAEERLARELRSFFASEGIDYGPSVSEYFLLRLARHVLRRERAAVRRARGKHLGYVCVSLTGKFCQNAVHAHSDKLWNDVGYRRARVVAVPKPRKGARK